MPMTIGNYWIYEFTELDKSNLPIGEVMLDSTVITDTKDFNGATFHTFVTFRNSKPIDTSYFSADNLCIYQRVNANKAGVPEMKDTTFKILELYKEDWFIFLTKNDSMTIDINDTTLLVSGEFNFHGYRNYGDDTIYIHDKKYIAISTKVVSDRRYQLWSNQQTTYLHNQPLYIYYAENIGPVLLKKESGYIVEQENISKKFWINGWQRQMIRYSIK
jgi:hypothetical protein